MKAQAKAMFGRTDFGYKAAGATERYGQFETPSEALRAAWALLRRFRSSNVVGRGKANFRALPVNESRLAFELRRADFEAQQAA